MGSTPFTNFSWRCGWFWRFCIYLYNTLCCCCCKRPSWFGCLCGYFPRTFIREPERMRSISPAKEKSYSFSKDSEIGSKTEKPRCIKSAQSVGKFFVCLKRREHIPYTVLNAENDLISKFSVLSLFSRSFFCLGQRSTRRRLFCKPVFGRVVGPALKRWKTLFSPMENLSIDYKRALLMQISIP